MVKTCSGSFRIAFSFPISVNHFSTRKSNCDEVVEKINTHIPKMLPDLHNAKHNYFFIIKCRHDFKLVQTLLKIRLCQACKAIRKMFANEQI